MKQKLPEQNSILKGGMFNFKYLAVGKENDLPKHVTPLFRGNKFVLQKTNPNGIKPYALRQTFPRNAS